MKTIALLIVAAVMTIGVNAFADVPVRVLAPHVVRSPQARPVVAATVRTDGAAARPVTQ